MTADALFMQFWHFFLCVYKTTSFSYAKDHSIVLKREEKGLLKFTSALFRNKRLMLDEMFLLINAFVYIDQGIH